MARDVEGRKLTPEIRALVEELIIAMETMTVAEAQGNDLARARAEARYCALLQDLKERGARG